MTRKWLVVASVAYAALIAGIVATANIGGTHAMFGAIGAFPYGDKLAHFVLVGVLALLVDLGWRRDLRLGRVRLAWAAVAIAAVALVEELTQIALPTRTFDVGDLSANWLGIVTFVGAGRWLRASRQPEEPRPSAT